MYITLSVIYAFKLTGTDADVLEHVFTLAVE
jgi:hypothetical protein